MLVPIALASGGVYVIYFKFSVSESWLECTISGSSLHLVDYTKLP